MREPLNIVKAGGQVVEDELALGRLLDSFRELPGHKILVHGGGRTATRLASGLGIRSRMLNGRRITDADTLKVVTMVYAGLVNKNIVAKLQARGIDAAGLCGADFNIILSQKRPSEPVDYGFVGDISEVNAGALSRVLESGAVPVICPITHDGKGGLLNTNADTVATAVAGALCQAFDVSLTFCFEKKGVLLDAGNPDSVISALSREDYAGLLESGAVSEGMIPKLDNAFKALEAGVGCVRITDAEGLGRPGGTLIV